MQGLQVGESRDNNVQGRGVQRARAQVVDYERTEISLLLCVPDC